MRKLIIYILIFVILAVWIVLRPSGDTVKVYLHQQDEVVEMDFEKYIMHVLAAEMPASFEEEALKAQAVAARTYSAQKISSGYDDPYHKGAEVCTDSTHCQAYRDVTELEDKYRKKIHSAVMATEGQVATYEGELIRAVFHSSAHGYTERSADVWGGDVPYLQSVASPWDADCHDYIAEVIFTDDEIRDIFNLPQDAPLIGEIIRSGAGGVMEMNLSGKIFKGTDIREKLNLRSTCFAIMQSGESVTFRTEGYGHGVGMSQWGAQGMAREGYTYDEILKHYYKGIDIREKSKNFK